MDFHVRRLLFFRFFSIIRLHEFLGQGKLGGHRSCDRLTWPASVVWPANLLMGSAASKRSKKSRRKSSCITDANTQRTDVEPRRHLANEKRSVSSSADSNANNAHSDYRWFYFDWFARFSRTLRRRFSGTRQLNCMQQSERTSFERCFLIDREPNHILHPASVSCMPELPVYTPVATSDCFNHQYHHQCNRRRRHRHCRRRRRCRHRHRRRSLFRDRRHLHRNYRCHHRDRRRDSHSRDRRHLHRHCRRRHRYIVISIVIIIVRRRQYRVHLRCEHQHHGCFPNA